MKLSTFTFAGLMAIASAAKHLAPLSALTSGLVAAAAVIPAVEAAPAKVSPPSLVLDIPTRYLNNASDILDALSHRVLQLSSAINHTVNHTPIRMTEDQAVAVAEKLRPSMQRLHQLLSRSTTAVRFVGLKVKAPTNLTATASNPECDGICVIAKAAAIVVEVSSTADHVIKTLGLDHVAEVVHPVLNAAKNLLKTLDGSIPEAVSTVAKTVEEAKAIKKSLRQRIRSALGRMLRRVLGKALSLIFDDGKTKKRSLPAPVVRAAAPTAAATEADAEKKRSQ